jgi:hypothetical protein
VNENEYRLQEEELKMKQSQDKVLTEMHTTLRELQQLNLGLQQELQQKEELYQLLRTDFNRVESKY